MAELDEFERAEQRAKARAAKYPRAISARYDKAADRVIITLQNGVEIGFAPSCAEGLENARGTDLKEIEITTAGFGLHFPRLDADLYIPSILEGVMGSRKWMAARLGAKGGSARSPEKRAASRENGKLGGRPRKANA